jgi:NADH-quinone oxidoreductase subunit A
MFIFLGILIIGLVYVWRKGDLDWIKPKQLIPTTDALVPASLYEKLNQQQSAYNVKQFVVEQTIITDEPIATATTESAPIRKPMFKPTFKKPSNDA